MVRKDVMLFKDAVCPTVIIECGFLSNPCEAQLLQKDEYQQQIAAGIMDGITEFTGREMPANVEIIDSLR
jgi:N-acetylmuramoyl-L-alanine amidase